MNGQYSNLSNEEYHAAHGISKSKLDAINISSLNYWDQYINPDRPPREEKSCFLIGSGTHALILEPHIFKEQYTVGFDKLSHPDALDTADDMRAELTKRGLKTSGSKSELIERLINDGMTSENFIVNLETDYRQSIGNKIIIPAPDYKHMLKSLEAINKHHTAANLIKGALVENSFFAQDEFGLTRKCRPDFITKNGRICCDLKSTNDVSVVGFGRSVSKFRYHVQGAWYLDTLKLAMGDDAPTIFSFIAVQKCRPYDVSVQFLTADQIELGRLIYKKNLLKLIECTEKNIWHGVDDGKILEVCLPKWEYFDNDDI